MNILITGSSGVGKSTVVQEIAAHGFTAIDGDEVPGLAQLTIAATGELAEWPEGYIDWSYYHWDLQSEVLKKVLSQDDPVFLGGVYSNQPDFYSLFDKIFVLTINPEEHLRRMRTRLPRESGDHEENIQQRLKRYQMMLQRFLDGGAIPVDASGSVSNTADAILKIVGHAD